MILKIRLSHRGCRGRCAALSASSTTHNSMRSGFVYKRRSKMATYNVEEVIDEHEFELLNQLEEEEDD